MRTTRPDSPGRVEGRTQVYSSSKVTTTRHPEEGGRPGGPGDPRDPQIPEYQVSTLTHKPGKLTEGHRSSDAADSLSVPRAPSRNLEGTGGNLLTDGKPLLERRSVRLSPVSHKQRTVSPSADRPRRLPGRTAPEGPTGGSREGYGRRRRRGRTRALQGSVD